ncbi:MAG: hypothetical protein K0R31_1626 [Clostridiales bacterium]|nr:hypothetical protein [Clostridiales bacterium]
MVLNLILFLVMLTLTVVLMKKGINIGYVMFMNAILVSLIMRIPIEKASIYMINGLASEKTLNILLLLILIMILENVMRTSGMIKLLSESLSRLVGDKRYVTMLLPAIIGLLPSAGGARFSCPMVEDTLGDSVPNEKKAFINFWFRHINMYSFLLSSSAILASSMLGISTINFFIRMIPFMVLVTLVGFLYVWKNVPREAIINTNGSVSFRADIKTFSLNMSPIIILIFMYVILLPFTKYALQLTLIGIILALFIINHYSFERVKKTLKEAFNPKLIIIICGVMVFNEVLINSGVMNYVRNFITQNGIPMLPIYLIFPILAGMLSGLAVAIVSLTFPILLSLGMGDNIWVSLMVYALGHLGAMITPMHICGMLTADFFNVKINRVLRLSAICMIPMFLVCLIGLVVLTIA